jgi:Transmembrane domain of unknown function (DUF3566)
MSDDDSTRPDTTGRGGAAASPRSGTAVQDSGESRADTDTDADAATSDSATTASLPAVGSPGDPYLDRNGRATRGSAGAPAVGPAPTAAASTAAASTAPETRETAAGPTTGSGSSAAASAGSGSSSALPPASMPPASMPPPSAPRSPSGRPAPPSAVDQYAALGLGGATAVTAAVDTALPSSTAPSAPGAPAAPPAAPPAATSTARRARGQRSPRRARLQLRHFNVWTVFKFSVVLAVALFFVWMIIVAVLYGTLDHLQAIDNINRTVRTIENDSSTNDAVTPRIVFTTAFLIGLVNIVLFIVLTTIGAVVYNLCADLVGGIEVTLAERD